MPLYEYVCGACGHRFEQIRKFSDSPLEVCPKCGEKKLHKLVSSPAIQFKGSGWYINDYAKKGTTDPSTTAPAAKSDDKSSSESSESGTAAKSTTSTDTVSASSTPSAPSAKK